MNDYVLLTSLSGLRGAPEVPPLYRETSVSRTANVGTVGMNGLIITTSLDIIPAVSLDFERSYLYISCCTDEN